MSNTPAERRAALKELEDKEARAQRLWHVAMDRPIPKRKISRTEIHKQAEQAQLREAFSFFGSLGVVLD